MGKNREERRVVKKVEKKGGKENKKCSTMPLMLFRFYRVRKSERKGQAFSANINYIQQDGIPSCRRCGAKDTVFYDHYERKAKLNSIDGKPYDVKIKAKRYRCGHCGYVYADK